MSISVQNLSLVLSQMNFTENISAATNHSQSQDGTSYERATWWTILLFSVLIFITIISNLLVVLSFVVEPRLRTPFNYYLLSMAVSDFLVGALDLPQYLASYTYYGYWPFGDVQCTFWLYVDNVIPSLTLWFLVVLSLDRVWAIDRPISYRRHNSRSKCFVALLAAFVITNLPVLPGFIHARIHFGNQTDAKACNWDVDGLPAWASSFYGVVVNNWLPTILTIGCYSVTMTKLCKARRKLTEENVEQRARIMWRMRKERQALIMLTLLVVALVVLYGPYIIYSIRQLLFKIEDPAVFYNVAFYLSYALSAVNPFLFSAGSKDIQKGLKRMFGGKHRMSVADVSMKLHTTRNSRQSKQATHRTSAFQVTEPQHSVGNNRHLPNSIF
ncbi:hypothetical protein RvY_06489 [Ramazzottius varieornatus]|uniref:G-protein coupled receptors family 1 profile domain-containing protein n=1 Tax=Ramazzottius varieornatus TaxID=947166 RepID=A0A1D1V1Q2_RAMVA|nr:hypothetical protein RvY_06489 [Ramazzottius varieornatus]